MDNALILLGVLLLGIFFTVRGEQEQARADAVASFKGDLAIEVAVKSMAQDGGQALTPEPQPDQTLWSEKRISQYEQSKLLVDSAPLAVLKISSLDIEVPVYNGTDELILDRGIGRIIGTAGIDEPGNLGLAGHRDGFFRGLKDIREGDEIELLTKRGASVYRVDSITVVDPSDVSVLAPTDDQSLTLVTCYPFYFVGDAPRRYIVRASVQSFLAMK